MKTVKIKEYYTPKEFSILLNVTPQTLRNWDKSGKFVANRTPWNKKIYTHEQYLQFLGIKNKVLK